MAIPNTLTQPSQLASTNYQPMNQNEFRSNLIDSSPLYNYVADYTEQNLPQSSSSSVSSDLANFLQLSQNATEATDPQDVDLAFMKLSPLDQQRAIQYQNMQTNREQLGLTKGYMDWQKERYDANQNSWQNQYLKPVTQGIQGLSSLANIYLGFQQLDMMKQQLGIAKEQWATTKAEIARINQARKNITKAYFA